MSQKLISEEMEEMIFENIEKSLPAEVVQELRERYDKGWSQ